MQALILSIVLTIASSVKVTWLPNSNFNSPKNFRDGKLPCSKQTIIFPDRVQGAVRFQSDNVAKELILPISGEMLLEGALYLGVDSKDECVEGNKYFIDKTLSSWAAPDVWASPRFNEATPDAERVPCSDDSVEFPINSEFSLFLPDLTQHIQELKIGNQYYDTATFNDRALEENKARQFYINNHQTTGIVVEENKCRSQAARGCPCQEFTLEIDCESKYCSVPACSQPIKPIGHCCKICGGTVSFERDLSFHYMEFKEFVDKIVASYKDSSIVYHVGIIPPNTVQVVIVEKGEYTGLSTVIANDIDSRLLRHWYLGAEAVKTSGAPLSSSGSGIKIIVSMFFAVLLVFGGIYAYYYKIPSPGSFLPSLPAFGRGSSAGILSRFDRRTESIVSLTRRDSTATVASGAGFATAFRNPLYDSKRGRVDVTESEVDDDKQ